MSGHDDIPLPDPPPEGPCEHEVTDWPANVRPIRKAPAGRAAFFDAQERRLYPPSRPSGDASVSCQDLVKALRAYQHLDDDRHVLFALAVAVSAHLDRDPLWGMLIGPSSGGKTETLRAVSGLADEAVDELTAPALLSWTLGKNRRPTGILARVGPRGFVTIGDFSTVLATSDRGGRDQLFALLRRVYDGAVTRDLGNAPAALRWEGRLTLLAACTPAIDHYSSHNDSLGPRWLYWRLPDRDSAAKTATGRQAHRAGDLAEHRGEVARIAEQLVRQAVPKAQTLRVDERLGDALTDVAVAACYGRGVVPRNSYGRREIEGMAVVEDPPRLVGQLVLLAKGLLALGQERHAVLHMCATAALHSIPQQRLAVLGALVDAEQDGQELSVSEVARRADCHRHVARFALEELECLGVTVGPDEDDDARAVGAFPAARTWRLDGPNAALMRSVLNAVGGSRGQRDVS